MEQKLLMLLEPLDKNDRSMIKIDAIFKSLNVETENDVKLLAQYFVNHQQYLELIKRKSYIQRSRFRESSAGPADHTLSKGDVTNGKASENSNPDHKHGSSMSSHRSNHDLKTVPFEKIDLIHPNDVLRALKTFVTLHHKQERQGSNLMP